MEHDDLINLGPDHPDIDLSAQTKEDALAHALAVAEKRLEAFRLATDPVTKSSIKAELETVFSEVERIKSVPLNPLQPSGNGIVKKLLPPSSTRKQTNAEQILVLKSSYVNDHKFPPWKTPDSSVFELEHGEPFYAEDSRLSLSAEQQAHLAGWKRPDDALPPPGWPRGQPPLRPTMFATHKSEFVQDKATDCSFVASLTAVVARMSRGHDHIMDKIIYPRDAKTNTPRLSANGRYHVKLNFNGTFRKIEIDDTLPVSKTDRTIHIVDRTNPSLLWPALVEKAYLKLRGGYDFPGSNSGTDLWALTGWIPEQIFVQDVDYSPVDVWKRIYRAHSFGDVLVTLGTGQMSDSAAEQIGLISEHDYAVLDMRQDEKDGRNHFLVRNPWCDGPVWKGQSTMMSPSEDPSAEFQSLLDADHRLSPGSFWIDINSVYQQFQSIYLNWNPGLFKERQDVHFSWSVLAGSQPNILLDNPQFTLSLKEEGVVWLLLNKHFSADAEDKDTCGFMSLAIFDSAGLRIFTAEGSMASSPFVDSPQVLLRLDKLEANHTYTIVPSQDLFPAKQHSFTLCAFANSDVDLERAVDEYQHSVTVASAWTDETAGGNAGQPSYASNPQYKLSVPESTQAAVVLGCADGTVPVHVKVVHGQGKRVHAVRRRDILVDSGDYRRNCTFATRYLEQGTYTIVASTYQAAQLAPFTLRVLSNRPTTLSSIPREGAGRIRTKLATAAFQHDQQRTAAPILPRRMTKMSILLTLATHPRLQQSQQQQQQQQWSTQASMVRVTLELGSGSERRILIASQDGQFSDSLAAGVRTDEIDVSPEILRGEVLWLVVERMVVPSRMREEFFDVELFYEVRDAIEVGVWRRFDDY